MSVNKVVVILLVYLFVVYNSVIGAQYQWTGAVDTYWGTPGNWNSGIVPGSDDTALFNTASGHCALTSDVIVKSIVFSSGYVSQFSIGNRRITVTGDIDFSSGGTFFITTFDTIEFNSSSLQKIITRQGELLPFIIKDGSGTLEIHNFGIRTMGLKIIGGNVSNYSALHDTTGNFISTGGRLNLNNGSLMISGSTDLTGIQNFTDTTGVINFYPNVSQTFKPNPSVKFPAMKKYTSYNLTIGESHFRARSFEIISGQVKMDTTFNIDSLYVLPGTVMMTDTSSDGHDTVMYLSGNGNLNVGNSELCFAGQTVDLSTASVSFGGINSALTFIGNSQTFIPSTYFMYNKVRRKGTGVTTVTTNGLRVDTLELISGELNLGNGLTDSLGSSIKMMGGSINFGTSLLRTGTPLLSMNGAGTIIPSNGRIEFMSMSTQNFIPPAASKAPAIYSSSDQLHIIQNRLRTSKLQINSGAVILDTTISADTLNVNYGAALMFDTVGNQKDTIGNIDGSGTLMFGKTTLHIKGDANFGYFNSFSGNADIEFGALDNKVFVPNSNCIFNKIKKVGANTLTINAHGLKVKTLAVLEGVLTWSSTYNDTIYDTILVKNSTLNLGSSPVAFRSLIDSNGVINFNYGSLVRFGGNGVINLAAAAGLSWNYGGINFEGNSGATVNLFPSPTLRFPPIHVNGNDTIKLNGNFTGAKIFQNNGGWDWGNNFNHTVRDVSVSGGMVAFGNSTVAIDSGNLMLESTTDVKNGDGTILFNAPSGIQSLAPPMSSSLILPRILKSDTSTLQILNQDVRCRTFRQTAGKLQFSGFGIIADTSIILENVDSLLNLDGITLQAGQSVRISGASGKMVHCTPATQWNINVPGTLRAENIDIGNCVVTGTTGIVYSPYIDAGGNSNWIFWVDTFPPDNDLILNVQSLDTGRVRIWWNPGVIDSSDAEFVGIRYSSSKMPDSMNDASTTLLGTFSLTDSVDTVIDLNAHTTYYFAAAVSDTSGNWADFTTNSRKSIRTRTVAPYGVVAPDTVHRQSFAVSWVNPAGLSTSDSIYIHTAISGSSSWNLYTRLSSVQTSVTIVLPAAEGSYRYLISTSHDSAGFYYPEDAFAGSVVYSITPPVITLPKDTFYNYTPLITWNTPSGMGIADSFFVFSDTVNGKNWILKGQYANNIVSHTFSFNNYGLYKVMVSTSWDKLGTIGPDNVAVDTLILVPSSRVYTWDSSPDSGYQTSNGTWGSDRFWSNDGKSITAWPGIGNTAIFGAATEHTVVGINGTQYADSIVFTTPGYLISGGALVLSTGKIRGMAIDTISSTLSSGIITKTGSGEVVVTGKMLCDTMKAFDGMLTINRSDVDTANVPAVLSVYSSLNGCGPIAKKVITLSKSSFTLGGGSAGNISLNDLSMAESCTLNVDIGTQSDTIVVKNSAVINGYLNISAVKGFGKGVYPIIICTGTIIDSGIKVGSIPYPNYTYKLIKESGVMAVHVDTLLIDTVKPYVKINIASGSYLQKMPSVISGNAKDNISGLLSVSLLINKSKDSTYWNGAGWQRGTYWLQVMPESLWNFTAAGIGGSEGTYIVKAGATDSAGNMAYDTTSFIIDTTAPLITTMFSNLDTIGSWNGLVSGESYDSLSLVKQVKVSVKDDSGKYYDGINWVSGDVYLLCNGTSQWSRQIDKSSLREGTYTVTAIVTDTIGNISLVPYSKVYRYFLKKDSVLPLLVYFAQLRSVAVNCSTINYFWNPKIPEMNDSIQLVLSLTGYPVSEDQGEFHFFRSRNDSSLMVSNIPGTGVTVYSKLFLKEKTGGYIFIPDSAATITRLADCVAPKNLVNTTVVNIGDSLTTIQLKAGNTDSVQILVGFGETKDVAVLNVKSIPNRDTLFSSRTVVPGKFYFSCAVSDPAGNRSSFNFDSVIINNTPPRLQSLTDTTIYEHSSLARTISASDINNDSLSLGMVSPVNGMNITGNVFTWIPGSVNIGTNIVIIECRDSRNAVGFDTFNVVVKDIPEAPVISYEGTFEVFEDSSFMGIINVTDPDNADTPKVSIVKLPLWMKLSENKLTGVPKNEDVGIHQVELICTEPSMLTDTLTFQVKVVNTNDKPVIISSSLSDTISEKQKYTFDVKVNDVDENDSIMVKNIISKTWLKISSVKKSDNGTDWIVQLSCAPVQIDTGLQEIKLEIADRASSVVYFDKKIRVLDSDEPPAKPVVTKRVLNGAVQINVISIDDRDAQLVYSVKLRALSNDSVVFKDSSVRTANVVYPLTDGKYEVKASAIDEGGLKSIETVDTFIVAGASDYVFKDTGWSMISIPSKTYQTANLKNTMYLLNWDEGGVEKQVYSYYRKKEELNEIEAAKAYWRKGTTSDTIHLNNSSFENGLVSVSLHKASSGWNQISSPYPYPVAWPRKGDVVWRWNAMVNDYEEVHNILEPWVGYWVRVDTAVTVNLSPVPVFSTGSLAKLRKSYFQNNGNWTMQVSIRAGVGSDVDNKFGFNQNALDRYDELDRPEPPAFEGRPVLYFNHEEWKTGCKEFASDIRKNWKSVNIFEIALSGSNEKEEGVLSFDGVDLRSNLYVFTKIGDSLIRVEGGVNYSVPLSKSNSYQTVFVTDNPKFLLTFPLHFKMGNPYPNPFCPSTRINYTIPYRWSKDGKINLNPYTVTIDIYDILGRKLRCLVYRKMTPGNYTVMWNGKSENGRIVASGKYYCILKADELKQIRNLTLIK